MNQTDPSHRTEPATADTAKSGRELLSKAAPSLRRGVESGAVTAAVGGVGLLSGLRTLLAGERTLGLAKLALGVGLLTAALVQRRSRNRSGTSDVEEIGELDTGTDAAPASVEQRVTPDTDVDREDLGEPVDRKMEDAGVEEETSDEPTAEESTNIGDGTETEEIERLGEAAFDSQSREVPAPQQAFNRGFLAHSSMVCWGIRERDDAVLIAQDYDVIEGRDGVTYVASSEIGTDVRELPIPDVVLDHWDEVFGGGTAVTGGDDILFVTTESLAADRLLRVLPSEWDDGLSA